MRDFWYVPVSGAERQRVQDGFNDTVARLSRERAEVQRDLDSDRRHERRVVALAAAIRMAITNNGDVFDDNDPVEEMAAAAVRVREQACGR